MPPTLNQSLTAFREWGLGLEDLHQMDRSSRQGCWSSCKKGTALRTKRLRDREADGTLGTGKAHAEGRREGRRERGWRRARRKEEELEDKVGGASTVQERGA